LSDLKCDYCANEPLLVAEVVEELRRADTGRLLPANWTGSSISQLLPAGVPELTKIAMGMAATNLIADPQTMATAKPWTVAVSRLAPRWWIRSVLRLTPTAGYALGGSSRELESTNDREHRERPRFTD
jgi:hypothetical protein